MILMVSNLLKIVAMLDKKRYVGLKCINVDLVTIL